ncbi:MAG: hypothetical protein EAZ51_06205 [Sphingobacteriales bacterium]|nr:MAG: hypothetical protein EAZ64_03265 [Sphingobacteriales bacterium]TAF80328.1 MAG: hypothetical protein EAZ51_06205 [Sphingobacteriales bacterium]
MYQKFEDRQKSPTKRFLLVLGIVMFSLYFVLGVMIIFWPNFPLMQGVEMVWKIAFGVLLIVYSFFRFIRLIKQG